MFKAKKTKTATDNFNEMFSEFGDAVAEIFNDPKLKKKVHEFKKSAIESAKTFQSRFQDDDVRHKFQNVGKAAERLGKNISDAFSKNK